jgi:hypothetical protein
MVFSIPKSPDQVPEIPKVEARSLQVPAMLSRLKLAYWNPAPKNRESWE